MATPHGLWWDEDSDIPEELTRAAHWIWERRATAKAAGFAFSEETITETVLLDMATSLSGDLMIMPFNKHEEGKTGADWEWCFYDHVQGRYLRFLMQAKLLDNQDRLYSHIDRYVGNSGVRQIDRLRATAKLRGIPALYAFYNHLTDESRVPRDRCTCHRCVACWGASVAPADVIETLLPKKSFATISRVSRPWLCLTCPATDRGDEDPIERVLGALEELDAFAREAGGLSAAGDDDARPRVETEPPGYFQIASMGAERSLVEPELREKLAGQNPGVDGVILVDATRLEPPETREV